MKSSIHEFWIRDDGQLMLDDRPLLGVKAYKMWAEGEDPHGIAHVSIELVCDVVGQHRRTRSLELAFRETMEALGEDVD